ncbi:tail fiber assembly protein [Escherichia coli]|nr:tail fiber assembly protein [Escherichia coli]EFJ8793644.1 tail fiber assembly protein [Escherichia coli]
MQNIKNFKVVKPTPKQLELYTAIDGTVPIFLQSEDGRDWFECHNLFSDETVKIMYDSDGIICSVVDEPVPERGGIYAVSMFYPENMSVAEIALSDYPEGVNIDGSWMYREGKIFPVPVDVVAEAEKEKTQRLSEAEAVIAPLQRAVKYGIATDEEKKLLEDWEVYTVLLNRVDASLAPNVEWPEKPGGNTEAML